MRLFPRNQTEHDRLAHWSLAVPILLLVAALSLRQIDLYLPTFDEFFSMFNSGWLVNSPYSPAEVIQSLRDHSPNHTPGYFLLLSAWGNLTTFEAAIGRVLTIFCALLSLAITYRVVSDFVSPVAGLFAAVILTSNAFYNFYIPHVRMYPLLLFTAGVVLWLYLRILYQIENPKRIDYASLCLAIYALANVHAFSATFFITLGIYHLVFVPKESVWWKVSSAGTVALILFSPFSVVLISDGIEASIAHWSDHTANGRQALRIWLTVVSNNQPMLLLTSVAGVAAGLWKKKLVFKPYLLLIVLYLLVLCIFAQVTPFVATSGMRHQFPGWLALTMVVSSGLYALYRVHKLFAILLLFWVFAGVSFQITADWKYFVAGRIGSFRKPAWHQLTRELSLRDAQSPVIGYRLPMSPINAKLHIGYSRREHYIDRNNIDFTLADGIADINEVIRNGAISVPEFWVIYQTGDTEKEQASEILAIASAWRYAACETIEAGVNTVMERYRWQTIGCEPMPESASNKNALIEYTFYAAQVDSTGSRVFFVDEWSARTEDSDGRYSMSYQLVSPDWDNVAQLELPLAHEGQIRQFSIDVSGVPQGSYRLMAVLYDKHSGRRVSWTDSGANPPELLPLAEILLE